MDYMNESFDAFVQLLFSNPPLPPFSYFIEMNMSPDILGNMIILGSQIIYGKNMCDLSSNDIGYMRQYLLSIGWDADYNMVDLYKEVLDYYPDGDPYVRKLKINNWQVTFKPADPALRPAVPCEMAPDMVQL